MTFAGRMPPLSGRAEGRFRVPAPVHKNRETARTQKGDIRLRMSSLFGRTPERERAPLAPPKADHRTIGSLLRRRGRRRGSRLRVIIGARDLVAFRIHALFVGIVVALLRAPLLAVAIAGADRRAAAGADARTDRRAAPAADKGAQGRAADRTDAGIQQRVVIGLIGVARHLARGILA